MKRKDKVYSDKWLFGNIRRETKIKKWYQFRYCKFNQRWTWKGMRELYGEIESKHRHRRSFIRCRLPKIVGNRVVYRLFKATRWFKEPNVKYGRKSAE